MSNYSHLFSMASAIGRVERKDGLRVTPTGAGSKDGSSWENAYPISDLNTAIVRAANEGFDVWLHADAGNYPDTTVRITAAGASNTDRVTIQGVDVNGAPKRALFVGNRANPWQMGLAQGNSAGTFLILTGAANINFKNINFQNCGLGCFRFGGNATNMTIEDCRADNVRGFQENSKSGSEPDASCTNILIRRCEAYGYSKRFGRWQYSSNNNRYEDCFGDSMFQDGDAFAFGISFDGKAHHIDIIRCEMNNHRDSTHGTGYWNADGFSAERGNHHLYFEDCIAKGNTDGGWDLKATETVLKRCHGEDNKRNYRLWGDILLDECTGKNPAKPPRIQASLGGNGGSGYIVQVAGYANSRIRVKNCKFEQDLSFTPFMGDENGFVAVDQYTLDNTTVPSGVKKMADNNPDIDGITTLWDHSDTTIPVIRTPATMSVKENATLEFTLDVNEDTTINVVGGQDAAYFTKLGRTVRLLSQDYENPISNPMRVNLRAVDANGNQSNVFPLAVTILDVNDDPIDPTEAFSYGNSQGCWFEIRPDTCWADTAMTIPAELDGPVAAFTDLSGKGNHAIQPNMDNQGYLRTDSAGRYWLELDGYNDFYMVGTAGTWRMVNATAVMAIYRDADAVGTDYLFGVSRGGTTSTPSWAMIFIDTGYYRLHVQPNVGGADGGAPRQRNSVLSMRTATGVGRASARDASGVYGMVNLVDLPDITGLNFNGGFNPTLRMFANNPSSSAAPTNYYEGRFYGGAILNQQVDETKIYRLERQFGQLNGINL
jgi:hypothetical protein